VAPRDSWPARAVPQVDHTIPRSAAVRKILLLVVLGVWCTAVRSEGEEPDAKTREGWRKMSQLGSGFVVWESKRTGRWRLWRRELDGSGLRQISPDEAGRDHYCPHISPDGTQLVYLSYPAGADTYQEKEPAGGVPLYLMQADGAGNNKLASSARSYAEDRAALWLDNNLLIYIDGDGTTRQMDVRNGKTSKLAETGGSSPDYGHGFLMNATKTHATSGQPTFSLYDAGGSRITGQTALEGCQPYFSHDGKWGFWMGGAGGPINRIDLKSRQVSPILTLNDPRMPKERGYLYFPMVSRDGRLFAFAASPNQHDHFTADYDIFVSRMDPKTMEVLGDPVRYTFDPGCDRFPDVFMNLSNLRQRGGAAPAAPRNSTAGSLAWPSNRTGLIYVFQTADKPNHVPAAGGRPERGYTIAPRGRARLDHNYAMVPVGGAFLASGAESDLLAACRMSNQLTVEAVIRPDHLKLSGPARIVTFSSSAYSRNFTLGQEQDKLIFRLRTPKAGENGYNPETTICSISVGAPLHVAITYRPGRLAGFVDGKEVYQGESVQGDFSNWAPHHLLFGDEFDGSREWAGTLEGVAIYNRALEPDEIQHNAALYRQLRSARKPVRQIEVAAKLLAKSPVPTLTEIRPYRQALMVCKYRVSKVLRGELPEQEVLVVQWALLDGQPQPVVSLQPGADVHLLLERSEDNPQLQRLVRKDTFESDREILLPRYYDASR
jgi:hypothetical protein